MSRHVRDSGRAGFRGVEPACADCLVRVSWAFASRSVQRLGHARITALCTVRILGQADFGPSVTRHEDYAAVQTSQTPAACCC